MAAAAKATTIPASVYVAVVNSAAHRSISDPKPIPIADLFKVYDKAANAIAGKFDFSFVAHAGPIIKAAVWDNIKKQYTNAEAADRYFRDNILAKVDVDHFSYLIEAAVMVGPERDNVDMVELVLQAVPKIGDKPMPLEGERFVKLAGDNKKTKTEAFLRKYFNLPAPAQPTTASGSAAAPNKPRTSQDLAADFAKLADADVALRDKLLAEFKALPEDFRNQVYGALYQIKPPANAQQNVMNYGELAFLHKDGFSSSGEEKSRAILAALDTMNKKIGAA